MLAKHFHARLKNPSGSSAAFHRGLNAPHVDIRLGVSSRQKKVFDRCALCWQEHLIANPIYPFGLLSVNAVRRKLPFVPDLDAENGKVTQRSAGIRLFDQSIQT